jgi:DNA-nicking Smr family endonuclease
MSEEDRMLWNLVARTAKPLEGRRRVEEPMEAVPPPPPSAPSPAPAAPAPGRSRTHHVSHALDEPTRDKLAKGRLPIEGRVDLHGMTQEEAYSLLFTFLNRAHAAGIRYVLVITGKGSSSGGDGILRRSVPVWLSTPAFRPLVSSHHHAARHHGGSGALYVRLRRTRG